MDGREILPEDLWKLIWKSDYPAYARHTAQQFLSLRIGERQINRCIREPLTDLLEKWGQEQRIAESAVNAANDNATDLGRIQA